MDLLKGSWEFLGDPVVKIPNFLCLDSGSIPGQETMIPQATFCGQCKKKKKVYTSPVRKWISSGNLLCTIVTKVNNTILLTCELPQE